MEDHTPYWLTSSGSDVLWVPNGVTPPPGFEPTSVLGVHFTPVPKDFIMCPHGIIRPYGGE